MTSFTLRWLSVAILCFGALLLTTANLGPWTEVSQSRLMYLVPVAYFSMLLGAAGLSAGWFLKQR